MFSPKRTRILGILFGSSLLAFGCLGDIGGEGAAGTPSGVTPSGPGVTPGSSGNQGGGGPGASAPGLPSVCGKDQIGPSPLHRLTKPEYDNTIRDLLGED